MTISSSLNASVSSLSANATRLSTISDNIANSSTYGYKRSETEFSSLVLQNESATYAAGGVTASTYKNISQLAAPLRTSNSTDISVLGRGLLPVTDISGADQTSDVRQLQLITTGSFRQDSEGTLRTEGGLVLLGWPTDTTGDTGAVSRTSGANLEPVNLARFELDSGPTTRIDAPINLPATATDAGSNGTAYNVPIEYYDNLGRTHTLTLQFTPTVPAAGSSNTWDLKIFDSSAGAPGTSITDLTLTFSTTTANPGQLATVGGADAANYNAATGLISLALPHGNVDINIGALATAGGITQTAGAFLPDNTSQDGAPIGTLKSVEIDTNGFIQGLYNTGFRRPLYQIPVADVANMNGLEASNAQSYQITRDSGNLFFWNAGEGPTGITAGETLLESTTDIASELTDLIETQRAYSSSAKIVQTVDEMLQETANLKR